MRPAEVTDVERALIEEAAWRMREAEGELSGEELLALEAWLDAAEAHRMAYGRIGRAWDAVGGAASTPELVGMRGEAFDLARRAARGRWMRGAFATRARVIALAASFLIAVLASAYLTSMTPRSYETAIGERRVVALADGSRVSLDAATQVRVRYSGARRQLWLEHGRAKFDVARDPLRPFTVTAESRTVVATGTSFSVELINEEVRVVLYEGHVAVLEPAAGGGDPRPLPVERGDALSPGQELIAASAAGDAARVASIDPVRSLSWEAGQIVFDDEPLETAVARMNRYTSTQLSLGDNVSREMRISGMFRAGDTTAFVEGVTTLLPVRAATGADVIVLSADPSRLSQ